VEVASEKVPSGKTSRNSAPSSLAFVAWSVCPTPAGKYHKSPCFCFIVSDTATIVERKPTHNSRQVVLPVAVYRGDLHVAREDVRPLGSLVPMQLHVRLNEQKNSA
jgi:hypothetical protein